MGPLTLLALLGVALGLSRVARLPHAQAFFFTTALVTLGLYVGAFAGALWWTALSVHVAGIALLGFEALRRARQPGTFAIPPPFGVLVLLCAWFWLVHRQDYYILYDEYSHWGIFTKEMLAVDGFWSGDTNSLHPRYPPGASLWQYLFNAFVPLSDGGTYFAHFVLLLAPLLTLWNAVRWSQPLWIVAIAALVLLAIANFGLGVSTLYVDQTVGVWYLGTLLAALSDENLISRRLALYAAPLAVIALLKDVGLVFAASGAVIISALFCRRLLISQGSRPVRKTALALVVLLTPMLACIHIWSWNRDAVGAPRDIQSVDGFVSGIADPTGNVDSERDAEIGRRLTEVFFDQQLANSPVTWDHSEFTYDIRELFTDSNRLTTFGLLVAFVLWWSVVACVLTGESPRQWLVVAGGVFLTAVVYIVGLHLSYRFSFGARALELPSYVRYVQVVALPMLLLSFYPLLPAFRGEQTGVWLVRGWAIPQRTAVHVTALLALYTVETPYLQPILESRPKPSVRTRFEPVVETIRAVVGMSRTWIYYTTDTRHGHTGRLALFLLTPTPASIEVSERFFEQDAATIAASWRGFEYVWLATPLTPEAAAGLARFSGGVTTADLYRVQSSTTGSVTLQPLYVQRVAHDGGGGTGAASE